MTGYGTLTEAEDGMGDVGSLVQEKVMDDVSNLVEEQVEDKMESLVNWRNNTYTSSNNALLIAFNNPQHCILSFSWLYVDLKSNDKFLSEHFCKRHWCGIQSILIVLFLIITVFLFWCV